MKQIALETLAQVTGGASKSSQLTTTLASINASISDLKNQNNNGSNSSSLFLPLALLAMNNRRQQGPTVVSAGGSTVVA